MLRVLAIGAVAAAAAFPQVIQLPRGFQPEGIEVGNGTTFYVGSVVNGASAPLRIRRIAVAHRTESNWRWGAGCPPGMRECYRANLVFRQRTADESSAVGNDSRRLH